MKKYYLGKPLFFLVFISMSCFFGMVIPMNGQNYPPQVQLPNVNYQNYQSPNESLPEYLDSFTDDLSGSTVVRIGDSNTFGTNSNRIRHNYSLDQAWNSDGTLIKLSGYPSAIIDAEDHEFLYWSDIPSYGRWSNTQPNIIYGNSGNRFVSHDINTNSATTLRTFSEYQSVDFGYGKGNQDNNDRYVGLIGQNGSTITLIVYDIQNDAIVSTHVANNVRWFTVSQTGEYCVVGYNTNGIGNEQGIKAYNRDFTNETHLFNSTPHGDVGIDSYGNEVYVGYGDSDQWSEQHSLFMARLDGGGVTNLFPYVNGLGIWGGHISTRNTDRPGWAYVSEQCCASNPVAPRELFAIKLDNSGTIERYGKHHSSPTNYNHQAQIVPNRNGTKIMFASNWDDSSVRNQNSAPSFVLEYPQNNAGISVNAGNDRQICEGESVTLTATGFGGNSFAWNTGETESSITVNPNTTTTYTVTYSDDLGNSVSDDVAVIVNPIPIANAGNDDMINEGQSITLTATGGTSFLWSTGEMSQSITVSPSDTTTYSVTVSENGCSSEPDEITVTVIPTPLEADAGQDVSICLGTSTVLTASGGSNYVWSTGETSQSITVNPQTTTTYTVTVSEGNESDTDSVVVTVNLIPTANAGNDVTINVGENTTLTASGGSSYEWNTGETTQNITVNPLQTTTYSVIVTNNACSSEADTVTVTVIPDTTTVNANAGQDVSICLGASTVLTASGGTDYLWSTGETSQSITVNPQSTTAYTVTVSEGNESDTDSVIVTVNPIPIANAGNDLTINEGESATLVASGGSSYLWSTGEMSQSITVNPTQTTDYSVVVSNNDCTSESDSVTITVIPDTTTVIANAGEDVTICQYEEVTLTATGGSSYEWSTGETSPTINVNPLSTTTYTVTVSNGQNSDTDSVIVNVNPLPAAYAGADEAIEIGSSIILTAVGGDSYLWSNGSTDQQILVNPTETTSFSVIATIGNCTDSDTVQVTVLQPLVANAGDDVTTCQGESVTLTASGGSEFLWSTGDTTESILVTPDITTEYNVHVFNGNQSASDSVVVTVNECEEENIVLDSEIMIFPNPAHSEINIKVTGFLEATSVKIYDLLGRQVMSDGIKNGETEIMTKTINVSNMPRGVFVLAINQNEETFSKRIILN